jgi:hypothetical protein
VQFALNITGSALKWAINILLIVYKGFSFAAAIKILRARIYTW